MEIFLICVIIILLLVILSQNKNKFDSIHKHIHELQQEIRKLRSVSGIQQEEKTKAGQASKPVLTPAPAAPVQPVFPEETAKVFSPSTEEQKPVFHAEQKTAEPLRPFAEPVKAVAPAPLPQEESKSWWNVFKENNPDLERFIGENLISKIGIAILVLGIGFFVKFAIDQDWINETARVGIGILCGAIVMLLAHQLHKKFKAFSSVLVSGAIAIFYFTIAIAFHEYHLFSQTAAFIIMVLITAFSIFTSILYDRMELAALSLVGGFATPFMLATGEGNYKILFIYILVLDIGMLVLTYLRRWNLINILAYVFTVILYGSWLGSKVTGLANAPYAGALFFGTLFYLLFIIMNVLSNLREQKAFSKTSLSILLSNTFLYYGAGLCILQYWHPELKGLFTLVLAAFNLVCSFILFRKFKADKNLIYTLVGLTLTLITLAGPIQLHGNYITLFWAVEAVLLIWLSQRSGIRYFRIASMAVLLLGIISLLMDWIAAYASISHTHQEILLNKGFITGFVTSLCVLGAGLLQRNDHEEILLWDLRFKPSESTKALIPIGVILLYLTGTFELYYQLNYYLSSNVSCQAITGAYHFTFSSILLFILSKIKNKAAIPFSAALCLLNILLYALYYNYLPYMELVKKLMNETSYNYAFIFHYLSVAAILYCMYTINNFYRHKQVQSLSRRGFVWFITLLVVFISSSELLLHGLYSFMPYPPNLTDTRAYDVLNGFINVRSQFIKIGFPILWGGIAFVLLALGIRRPSRELRVISLTLLAITVAKLFIYDIKNVPEAGKILAFVMLGVVLLIMSFMYQKIKSIILSDEKNN